MLTAHRELIDMKKDNHVAEEILYRSQLRKLRHISNKVE